MFLYLFDNSLKLNYYFVGDEVENLLRVFCILYLDLIKGSYKGGFVNIFLR